MKLIISIWKAIDKKKVPHKPSRLMAPATIRLVHNLPALMHIGVSIRPVPNCKHNIKDQQKCLPQGGCKCSPTHPLKLSFQQRSDLYRNIYNLGTKDLSTFKDNFVLYLKTLFYPLLQFMSHLHLRNLLIILVTSINSSH